MPPKSKPDHEQAMNFARKRHHKDVDVRNLARAYVEAVKELQRLAGVFDDMERRIASIDTGPLDITAYLGGPVRKKRKKGKRRT